MELFFEEENLSIKQECSALTGNLEGTDLNLVMTKRATESDSTWDIFDILFNRFGSGVQRHLAMAKFEKGLQRDDESIDKFMDNLELLRKRSNPDQKNPTIVSKLKKGVKNDELKTILVTQFTLSADSVPTQDELRKKTVRVPANQADSPKSLLQL